MAQGVPILEELAFKTYTSERVADELQKQLMSTARQVIKRIPSLSEATMKWMDQYQKGRFEVTVDTSELSKEVDKLNRLGREIVLAIMLVGMVVGSAIATNAPRDVAGTELGRDLPLPPDLRRVRPGHASIAFVIVCPADMALAAPATGRGRLRAQTATP